MRGPNFGAAASKVPSVHVGARHAVPASAQMPRRPNPRHFLSARLSVIAVPRVKTHEPSMRRRAILNAKLEIRLARFPTSLVRKMVHEE